MNAEHDRNVLTRFAAQVLAQAHAVARDFARRAESDYAAHVGPHLRHVIEHFRALLAPAEPGVVAYDARPRDARLSACPVAAQLALDDLLEALHRHALAADAPVRVVGVVGADGAEAFALPSTFGRELVYASVHAVHHFALIKPHCVAAGVALAPEFGVAPATVAHARAAAATHTVSREQPMSEHLFDRVRRRALLLFGVAALFFTTSALAAPPINTLKGGLFGGHGDTAILGYDPVAYFTDGKPVKGQDAFVFEWMGAKWKFASQGNLDLFKANPEQYAPQYGGYCAYGVAENHLVSIEPDKFTIIDGKLYLNYDAGVQATWLKDPAGYIRAADSKFRALLGK